LLGLKVKPSPEEPPHEVLIEITDAVNVSLGDVAETY
jgi:hypothetical protein